MTHKSIIIPTLLSLLLVLAACESKQSKFPGEMTDEEWDNRPTLEDLICDSLAEQEDISIECAELCNDLNYDIRTLSMVNSPTALIRAKHEHQTLMATVASQAKSFKEHDRTTLKTYSDKAADTYQDICHRYEIPASGVIANLEQLTREIDKVNSPKEFEEYDDHHYGVMQELDHIYLCIEHRSPDIPKVKRLAMALKEKYEAKRQAFEKE